MRNRRIKELFKEWLIVWLSVFVLYQMLWPILYNFPANFFKNHGFIATNLQYLAFNAIYCAVSLFIAYKCVWLAKKRKLYQRKLRPYQCVYVCLIFYGPLYLQ